MRKKSHTMTPSVKTMEDFSAAFEHGVCEGQKREREVFLKWLESLGLNGTASHFRNHGPYSTGLNQIKHDLSRLIPQKVQNPAPTAETPANGV